MMHHPNVEFRPGVTKRNKRNIRVELGAMFGVVTICLIGTVVIGLILMGFAFEILKFVAVYKYVFSSS